MVHEVLQLQLGTIKVDRYKNTWIQLRVRIEVLILTYKRGVLLQVQFVNKMLASFFSKQIWKFETVNI